jgi:hypothetical protein
MNPPVLFGRPDVVLWPTAVHPPAPRAPGETSGRLSGWRAAVGRVWRRARRERRLRSPRRIAGRVSPDRRWMVTPRERVRLIRWVERATTARGLEPLLRTSWWAAHAVVAERVRPSLLTPALVKAMLQRQEQVGEALARNPAFGAVYAPAVSAHVRRMVARGERHRLLNGTRLAGMRAAMAAVVARGGSIDRRAIDAVVAYVGATRDARDDMTAANRGRWSLRQTMRRGLQALCTGWSNASADRRSRSAWLSAVELLLSIPSLTSADLTALAPLVRSHGWMVMSWVAHPAMTVDIARALVADPACPVAAVAAARLGRYTDDPTCWAAMVAQAEARVEVAALVLPLAHGPDFRRLFRVLAVRDQVSALVAAQQRARWTASQIGTLYFEDFAPIFADATPRAAVQGGQLWPWVLLGDLTASGFAPRGDVEVATSAAPVAVPTCAATLDRVA